MSRSIYIPRNLIDSIGEVIVSNEQVSSLIGGRIEVIVHEKVYSVILIGSEGVLTVTGPVPDNVGEDDDLSYLFASYNWSEVDTVLAVFSSIEDIDDNVSRIDPIMKQLGKLISYSNFVNYAPTNDEGVQVSLLDGNSVSGRTTVRLEELYPQLLFVANFLNDGEAENTEAIMAAGDRGFVSVPMSVVTKEFIVGERVLKTHDWAEIRNIQIIKQEDAMISSELVDKNVVSVSSLYESWMKLSPEERDLRRVSPVL